MKKQPTLIFVRGLPGSGKSYLSDALAKKLGHDETVLVDPDAIDRENEDYLALSNSLTREGLNPAIHPFRWLRKSACEGISASKTVIWNQPFTDRGVFDRLILFIKENSNYDGNLKVLVVEVAIDHVTAKRRISDRIEDGGHGPSDATFQHRVEEYVSFSDGYDTIAIDGSQDAHVSIGIILNEMKLQ